MNSGNRKLYRIVVDTERIAPPKKSVKATIHPKSQPRISPRYNDKLCIICFDERVKKDMMITPCNHLCLCGFCAKKLKNSNKEMRCPYCNSSVEDIVQVYIV